MVDERGGRAHARRDVEENARRRRPPANRTRGVDELADALIARLRQPELPGGAPDAAVHLGDRQSTVVEPKLYKAAVAIAPVTDLEMVRSESKGFTNNRLVRDFVGSGEHLAEGSPLQNVAAIQVPVLLAHGDRDANVGIAQSEKMDAALRSAGKKSELIRFKELDHQLNDSDARVMLLTRVGEFLDKAIGH